MIFHRLVLSQLLLFHQQAYLEAKFLFTQIFYSMVRILEVISYFIYLSPWDSSVFAQHCDFFAPPLLLTITITPTLTLTLTLTLAINVEVLGGRVQKLRESIVI